MKILNISIILIFINKSLGEEDLFDAFIDFQVNEIEEENERNKLKNKTQKESFSNFSFKEESRIS